jgi:hypothetical protein
MKPENGKRAFHNPRVKADELSKSYTSAVHLEIEYNQRNGLVFLSSGLRLATPGLEGLARLSAIMA